MCPKCEDTGSYFVETQPLEDSKWHWCDCLAGVRELEKMDKRMARMDKWVEDSPGEE